MPRSPELRLEARYRRLMVGIALPLFAAVVALAIHQYQSYRTRILDDLARGGAAYALALDGIAKLADDHVRQMQSWSLAYLSDPPEGPSRLRSALTPRFRDGTLEGYTLDGAGQAGRPVAGQLAVLTDGATPADVGGKVLDQALDLFTLMRPAHQVNPYFSWSYFFSATRDFISLYPWIAGSDLIEGAGHTSFRAGVKSWFDYEIYLAGTPERNPDRAPYWTEPYLDAAGAGAMVSHGAPVDVGGRFYGIVGTDLRLATLDEFLASLPRELGRLVVLNDAGQVLADSVGAATDVMRRAEDVLPHAIAATVLERARAAPGEVTSVSGHAAMAYPIARAPWTLLFLATDQEIGALLLPRLVPYALIIAGLAATFLVSLEILRRELIRPALALVGFIRELSRDPEALKPSVPERWKPWFDLVSETFVAHREASQRLKESEAVKSAIVENALLAIVTMDEAGRVVEFNPAAETLFGHRREDVLNADLADLMIPPPRRSAHRDGLARYLRTGASRMLGARLALPALRADGAELQVELSVSATHVGGRRYFTAFIADLSDKQRAEEAVRASEEQYRAIFNATSDALMLWAADGRVVDTNLAHRRLSGYTLEEIRTMSMIDRVHPSSRPDFRRFEEHLARGEPFETVARVFAKDGRVVDVEVRSVPMLYRGRQHALVISRDITELKRAEEELARQRDALLHSEKLSAMGALLAGVAHELNNPLAILMGRAALLEGKTRDAAIQSDVRKIHDAADRCGRIVRTFLAMARRTPGERKPILLNDLVIAALDLLGYGLRAAGVAVQTELAPDLPRCDMDGDQIGQVIVNLIVNAQQALEDVPPPRSMRVTTFRRDASLYLRVEDTGPGVPSGLRERIFDPFFTTKAAGAGTGVGLSVCRGILREHGGTLILEEGGEGARFLASIPLRSVPAAESRVVSEPAREASSGHALIVDDEPEVADLLGDILESAGFRTTRLCNGRDAAGWLEDHDCDLVISDIRMPDLDGPALWRLLNARRPELARRMAFITGDTLSAGVAAFLEETGLLGLEKPFTPEDVLSLVAAIESA